VTHLCFIAFLSLHIVLIDVLIYSAAQLQECLINLFIYLLTYLLTYHPQIRRGNIVSRTCLCGGLSVMLQFLIALT